MTGVVTNIDSLQQRIEFLEQRRKHEQEAIVAEFADLKEHLKPAALFRSAIASVRKSPELKADLIRGAVGLASGFLTNKVLLGKLKGPWKKIFALLVQAGFVNVAVNHTDTIRDKVLSAITGILKSIRLPEREEEAY